MKTLCLVGIFMSTSSLSFAQDASTASTPLALYTPADFVQYSPRTAADILERIPNFSIRGGNNGRGLGQGGANVLINGSRISGKNNDARAVLGRIPTSSVVQVEILDGVSLGIPGLTGKIANITTNNTKGLSGTWRYTAEFQQHSRANVLGFETSITGTKGPFEYTLGAKNNPFRNNAPGPEDVYDANGTHIEHHEERVFFFGDRPSVSADISYAPANGHIGHMNGQFELFNFRNEDQSRLTAITSAGDDGEKNAANSEDEWNMEIGMDYALDVGPGNLKLIAIKRIEDSENTNFYTEILASDSPYISEYHATTLEGETIGRAEYSWAQGQKHDWQTSIEGAFNYLDRSSTFLETGQTIPSPDASRVEEKRAEASVTHGWRFSPKLSLQASASAEYSQLSQTGQSGKTREFFRPKGFVSTSYAYSDTFDIRTKLARRVGQLNFNTFVNSVDLSDKLKNSGNPDIVPTEFWAADIEFEKQWDNGVSGTFKLYGRQFENIVDRIAIVGGDAPGNIDKASMWGVRLNNTVKLDDFGLPGMQFDSELEARNTYIIDPFTGVTRSFSNHLVHRYNFKLRHDIPNTDWAWNLRVRNDRNSPNYRYDRTDHFTRAQPFVVFSVEHKNIMGMKVSAFARNILSQDNNFTRSFWDGSRTDNIFKGSEYRTRNQPPRFGINVSGTI